MKQVLILLTILVAITCKVEFVTQMYRHGARTTTAKNLYDSNEQKHGVLTGVGMRQQYGLGQIMREKYVGEGNLLSETLNFNEILVTSTDFERTYQSATSNLFGLYPLGSGQDLYPNVEPQYTLPPYEGIQYEDIGNAAIPKKYQPPIIHTTDKKTQLYLYPKCKNIDVQLAKFASKPSTILQIKKVIKDVKPLIKQSQELLGDDKITLIDLPAVYDVLIADLYQGRKMPEGFSVDSEYWINMQYFLSYISYFGQQDTQVLNIVNSNFWADMIHNLDQVVNEGNPTGLVFRMWSAHDSNLTNFLPALNITSSECIYQTWKNGSTDALNCQASPPFAASLNIELHSNEDNEYVVKIDYNGEYQNMCDSTEDSCKYDEFISRLSANVYSQKEQDELCKNETGRQDAIDTDDIFKKQAIVLLAQEYESEQQVENVEPSSETEDIIIIALSVIIGVVAIPFGILGYKMFRQ